jgi:SAM-dependent methyltransferase
VIEALHHFPDYDRALGEIHRVLKPGGVFYSYEPNALNPLRRLSEVRDRLRGTIEKSFYAGQVKRLCRRAGFDRVSVTAVSGAKSVWKMEEVPVYRRWLARLHGFLQARFPVVFGPLIIQARKAGVFVDSDADAVNWRQWLRSPVDGKALAFDSAAGRWQAAGAGHSFPDRNGIPVLISGDEKQGA